MISDIIFHYILSYHWAARLAMAMQTAAIAPCGWPDWPTIVAGADVDQVLPVSHHIAAHSAPGPHLHVVETALLHIGAGAEHHARLRSTSESGAAWWTQMQACTNADLLGLGEAVQQRPGGHAVRVHGVPCGASRVMPNDVPIAAILEEVDAAVGLTIVVRDPWDPLGNDGHRSPFGRLSSTAGTDEGLHLSLIHI